MKLPTFPGWRLPVVLLGLLVLSAPSPAQTQSTAELVEALQSGGHVIVLRHASSPRQPPDAETANEDNPDQERQLDQAGRRDAAAIGGALARLGIGVDETLTSPAYRAVETARRAGLTPYETVEQLGSEGMRNSSEAYAQRLRDSVAEASSGGGNRVLITHRPNVSAAFPDIEDVGEGDALVFEPAGGAGEYLGRIGPDEWAGVETQ